MGSPRSYLLPPEVFHPFSAFLQQIAAANRFRAVRRGAPQQLRYTAEETRRDEVLLLAIFLPFVFRCHECSSNI